MTSFEPKPRVALWLVVALIAGLFAVAPAGAQAPASPAPLFADAVTPPADGPNTAATARSRYVTVDRAVLDNLAATARAGGRPQVGLRLFADAAYTGVVTKIESSGSGFTMTGSLKGRDGYFYLVTYASAFIAHVASTDGVFEVSLGAGGRYKVVEIDHSKLIDEPPSARMDLATADGADAADLGTSQTADAASSIDIMVVYTPAARSGAGSTAAMKARIALAVAETNLSYANAGVTPRLRLVHVEEVYYSETGNLETDLDRLRTRDGYMDVVHTLRNTYGADMVALIVENGGGYCGMASAIQATASQAFQVTARPDCMTGYYTFGHEFGHLQGARHDVYVDSGTTPYAFGHGWVHPYSAAAEKHWRTVMAYNNRCQDWGYNCTRLQYWSNNGVTYGGDPMGSASARNFQVLNNTAARVANFRIRVAAANFNSNFNLDHEGWATVFGTWTHFQSAYYRTPGVPEDNSSISRTLQYGDITYQVRVKRTGCGTCANYLAIRGDSRFVDDTKRWLPAYYFQYTADGAVSVWLHHMDGTSTALLNWTDSAAINQGQWNILKVVAIGSALRFYINGTLVWAGSDTTLRVGNVGVGMYRSDTSTGDMLTVDWAKLSLTATADLFTGQVADGTPRPGGSIDRAP